MRVTPRKAVSIPRLKLTAATILAKTAAVLKKELECKDTEEFYWTESKVMLGFINNESRRFRSYVANRMQTVRLYSTVEYKESSLNAVYEGSRGLTVQQLMKRSTNVQEQEILLARLARFSDWQRLIAAAARCVKFK